MKQLILCALALVTASAAYAHDYPTVDRVEYVHECMRNNTGPYYEMLYKCSCAIDAIAADMPYDQYTNAATASNAMSIGGERGAGIRDAQMGKDLAAQYKAAQAKAKRACFINDPATK